MTRFEAVALACLALMIVVAVLFGRSATTRGRARKPGDSTGGEVTLFQPDYRHPDHQPQGGGHSHSHHGGSGHGSDGGHAGVDAGHAGIDGGGGGVH